MDKQSSTSFRLRGIVASIFAVIFIVVCASVSYLNGVAQNQGSHYEILASLEQLDDASQNLKQRGQYYIDNAPRDYESYFRDVAVFHQEMQSDLQQFDNKLMQVVQQHNSSQEGLFANLQQSLYQQGWENLAQLVTASSTGWKGFRSGLNEQLGDNKAEPRLEWGAKFIINNADELSAQLEAMISAYRTLLSDSDANNQRLANIAFIVTAVVILLGLALTQWIMWRIGRTASACTQVANGDFGYQLPDSSSDEIGVMVKAFNSLSGRISFLFGLLTKLNSTREPGAALEAFWDDSQSYLDADWMGLMIMSRDDEKLVLTNQQSRSDVGKWQHRQVDLSDSSALGKEISGTLQSGKAYWCENIQTDVTDTKGSPFLRELMQKTMMRSMVVVPLINQDKSWKAALVIGKGLHRAFDNEQLSLLNNLAPVIGSIFANASGKRKVVLKKAPVAEPA